MFVPGDTGPHLQLSGRERQRERGASVCRLAGSRLPQVRVAGRRSQTPLAAVQSVAVREPGPARDPAGADPQPETQPAGRRARDPQPGEPQPDRLLQPDGPVADPGHGAGSAHAHRAQPQHVQADHRPQPPEDLRVRQEPAGAGPGGLQQRVQLRTAADRVGPDQPKEP